MADEDDPTSRAAIERFLSAHLKAEEMNCVSAIIDAHEPEEILSAAQAQDQKACMALFAMLRDLASVAPSDAAFMIGYDPLLLRSTSDEDEKSPEQRELEWWQELMGFLFVGTFDGRWPDIHQAIEFRNELLWKLKSFARVLGPREEFWQRVGERRQARVGFRPDDG